GGVRTSTDNLLRSAPVSDPHDRDCGGAGVPSTRSLALARCYFPPADTRWISPWAAIHLRDVVSSRGDLVLAVPVVYAVQSSPPDGPEHGQHQQGHVSHHQHADDFAEAAERHQQPCGSALGPAAITER